MANARLVTILSLAAANFALALINTVSISPVIVQLLSNGALIGICITLLAVMACVVGWNQGSYLLAELFAASSVAAIIPAIMATRLFALSTLTGSILAVVHRRGILVPGSAKGIMVSKVAMPTIARGDYNQMTRICISRNVPVHIDRVWDIICDIDSEPRYYPGLNSVRNVCINGNIIEREVRAGFQDSF